MKLGEHIGELLENEIWDDVDETLFQSYKKHSDKLCNVVMYHSLRVLVEDVSTRISRTVSNKPFTIAWSWS